MCFRIRVIKPNADSFKFERVSTWRCRPMVAHPPFGDRVMERIVAATKATQTPAGLYQDTGLTSAPGFSPGH